MKTVALFLFAGLILAAPVAKAQNPIPSWNVAVNSVANFQESSSKSTCSNPLRGKRNMNIKARGAEGQSSCQATVWVYSLDEQDILGPYPIQCEETIIVEIDEREWGVLVESEDHVYVDVWIE